MRKLAKGNAPDFLTESLQNQLGEEYQTNRNTKGTKHKFDYWHKQKVGESTLYQSILRELKALSSNHCFYCDDFPPRNGDETIDHFKPKSKPEFYLDICRWENLYLACNHCQLSKKTKFSELLLRPDELNYDFWEYFDYDYRHDRILTNSTLDELGKQKAQITIDIFNFNHIGQTIRRRNYRKLFDNQLFEDFNDLGYRFLFE